MYHSYVMGIDNSILDLEQEGFIIQKDGENFKEIDHQTGTWAWKIPHEDGTFELWSTSDLDFGRSPFDVLCTTYQKIPYFIAAYGYELISKIIMENIPEVKRIKKPIIIISLILGIIGAIGHQVELDKNTPTALDVYRGKTTLEITYRDSVAIDSTVVYKVK